MTGYLKFDRYRRQLLPKELKNLLFIWLVRLYGPLYRRLYRSDVAFMLVEHPVLLPFIVNCIRYLGISIHLVKPDESFSGYRKVIIPNGHWPTVKSACERIPSSKKVFCEIGFIPQNSNVYFDPEGVHGHASLRNVALSPLSTAQQQRLDSFKLLYNRKNYVRVKWATVDISKEPHSEALLEHGNEFIFVPLQLESDTAFDLCPFDNNQELISYVERALPTEKIVFKMHPLDHRAPYEVCLNNVMLPTTNKDLQKLLKQSKAVVGSNSTVILEALMYGKKCATLGTGLSTNHNITLECHENLSNLNSFATWEPDWRKVDSFLYLLIDTQINVDFFRNSEESDKLIKTMKELDIYYPRDKNGKSS